LRGARASLLAAGIFALLTFAVIANGAGSELRPDFNRASCGYPTFEIDALKGPTGAC
jgi:hypothetical protein